MQDLPQSEAQLVKLAIEQQYISKSQAKAASDLYLRYQKAERQKGDRTSVRQPSLARILLAKGWLERRQAEALLKHIITAQPLPSPEASLDSRMAREQLEVLDMLGLEPPESGIALAVDSSHREEGSGLGTGKGSAIKGYKLLDVLGEGSLGVLYRAHQISMDRTVALKVLPAGKTKDPRFVEEFLKEARNAGKLNHPNLVRVHEVGKSGDSYYYSMEYIEGQRLHEMISQHPAGKLPPKLSIEIILQTAQALEYAFQVGLIHRAISINSIMVTFDRQTKLADLGLKHDLSVDALEQNPYAAPEQIKEDTADARSDIYALGCCLYHCLMGQPPFEGLVLKQRLLTGADLSELSRTVPAELAKLVAKMISPVPEDRHQSPEELVGALQKISTNLEAKTPSTRIMPTRKFKSSSRRKT